MNLNDYLKLNQISCEEFAKKSGVSPNTIYRYKRGEKRAMQWSTAKLISKATDGQVSVEELLDG